MKTKILDCTIRDGGHLNQWQFSNDCVRASYYAAARAGVDYFEVGYRFPDSVSGLGEFAYCRDAFLSKLVTPYDKCKLAVMMDCGKSDHSLFLPTSSGATPVKAVRVATYPDSLEKAMEQTEALLEKGYEVFLNLMAYSELSGDHFRKLSAWSAKDKLQAVYFADSFGSFLPEDIPVNMKALRDAGVEKIGFHPHNNMQMAFANTLAAIGAGATHVDASIFGMGRGTGNLPVEAILGYLEKKGGNYNPVPYLDVAERYFLDLYKKFYWGYSIPGFLSGLKGIHPYYASELFAKKSYTIDEIWDILAAIKGKCPVSYSPAMLGKALDSRFYVPVDAAKAGEVKNLISDQFTVVPAQDYEKVERFNLQDRFTGRNFLVLSNGPSVKKFAGKVLAFAEAENCVTIGVNRLPEEYVPDFHVFISRKRFLSGVNSVSPRSVLLVPSFFGKQFVEENYTGKYEFFEVGQGADLSVAPLESGVQRPVNINVSISAMLLAAQMGAARVYAAGMDGYLNDGGSLQYFYDEEGRPEGKDVSSLRYDLFRSELERVWDYFQKISLPFSIITPTSHRKYFANLMHTEEK